MSQIEQEIKHNIDEGMSYAGQAKKGAQESLGSFTKAVVGFIPSFSYYQDQEGRVFRVITPAPLQVLLFKKVPRYELVTEGRV